MIDKTEKYVNIISYSQYKMWNTCPFQWKLRYVDKIREDFPSVELVFGTGAHVTIQQYLTGLFARGIQFANQIEVDDILRKEMGKEYVNYKNKLLENHVKRLYPDAPDYALDIKLEKMIEKYISKSDMIEYYNDGIKILNYLKKNRLEFFNISDEELVAIEFPLDIKIREYLKFVAYIDILIKNKKTGKIRIIDLKTSRQGWKSYKKNDRNTTDQLMLYKYFYSNQFGVDLNNIDVEFIILKRKLYEDIPYKQKRILKFIPANGKPTVNRAMTNFNLFIESCFDEYGNYKKDTFYPKIPTTNNCRFCAFKDRPELCDKKN